MSIFLAIIFALVWLFIGYVSLSKFCRALNEAPPIVIIVFSLALGPLFFVVVFIAKWLINVHKWMNNRAAFDMEKYVRKFLRMKEK